MVLYQGTGKDKRVLTYSSQTLLLAKTQYTIAELETLVIIWGIKLIANLLTALEEIVVTNDLDRSILSVIQQGTVNMFVDTLLTLMPISGGGGKQGGIPPLPEIFPHMTLWTGSAFPMTWEKAA